MKAKRCKKHPGYKGNYPPRVDCPECKDIWEEKKPKRQENGRAHGVTPFAVLGGLVASVVNAGKLAAQCSAGEICSAPAICYSGLDE